MMEMLPLCLRGTTPATGHHEKRVSRHRKNSSHPSSSSLPASFCFGDFESSYGLVIGLKLPIPPGLPWVFHSRMPKSFLLSQPFLLIHFFILNMIFFLQKGGCPKVVSILLHFGFQWLQEEERVFYSSFSYICLLESHLNACSSLAQLMCKEYYFSYFQRTLKRGLYRLAQDSLYSRTKAVCLPPPQPIWSLVSPHALLLPRVFCFRTAKTCTWDPSPHVFIRRLETMRSQIFKTKQNTAQNKLLAFTNLFPSSSAF